MGLAVNDLLVASFPKLLDVDFTAGLEENLDQIEEGQANHLEILNKLYNPLAASLDSARQNMINIKVDGLPVDTVCPKCQQKGTVSLRYGRNGFYLSCTCGATNDYTRDEKGLLQPVTLPIMEKEILCEFCQKPMVLKKGRYGTFLACSGYPDCKNTKHLKIEKGQTEIVIDTPPPLPENFNTVCEKCQGQMVPKKTRKGSWFIACSNYPKCKNAKSYPSDIKCPTQGCDGDIVEKSSARGTFYGCSNYPVCCTILRGKPVKEPCPICGSPFQVINSGKKDSGKYFCPNKECSNYQAPISSRKKTSKTKSTVAGKKGAAKKTKETKEPKKTKETKDTKETKAAKQTKKPADTSKTKTAKTLTKTRVSKPKTPKTINPPEES
jgi:DNA topoisomerase-1